jgi:hypothetical protein
MPWAAQSATSLHTYRQIQFVASFRCAIDCHSQFDFTFAECSVWPNSKPITSSEIGTRYLPSISSLSYLLLNRSLVHVGILFPDSFRKSWACNLAIPLMGSGNPSIQKCQPFGLVLTGRITHGLFPSLVTTLSFFPKKFANVLSGIVIESDMIRF